jgi:type IV pilus assembly protein PilE
MKRSSGFTLIELMITVVIVAILVSVALPSYQRYVARAVRASGQQFLTDLAQRQEQYFLDVRQYATGLGVAAGQVNLAIPDQVATKYQAPVFTVNNAAVPPT